MRCVIPHANLEIRSNGTFGPCCINYHTYKDPEGRPYNISTHSIEEVWNSHDRRSYASMLDEAPHEDCRQCWNIEAGGGKSKRMGENAIRRVSPDGPTGLDIKFSNICNLRCVICGPYNSNQWYDDWKAIKGKEYDGRGHRWVDDDAVMGRLLDLAPTFDVIEFYGGEPLLIKQHLEMLERCVSEGSAGRQEIRFNTNGTVYLTDRHIELYSRFRMVHISWSIDAAVESEFEYQRFPAKFNQVVANLDRARGAMAPNTKQNITHTLSAMNVLSIPDMLDFARQRPEMYLHINILSDPTVLHWSRVPRDAVEACLRDCSTDGIRFNGAGPQALLSMPYDRRDSNDLISYLSRLDELRGTSWRRSLPRLGAVL